MTPHSKNKSACGSGLWHALQRPLQRGGALLALLALFSSPLSGQLLPSGEIDPLYLRLAEKTLAQHLANDNEEAFLQVLTETSIVRDALIDTTVVYDLVVHYDPERYANPRVGTYPLRFEEQFVLWGKRIADYTKGTEWKSGRFYLRDLSTGRVAWIFTADTRRLYVSSKNARERERSWVYTDLETTAQWLRSMREETRAAVEIRLRQEAEERAQSLTKDLNP